MKSLERKNEDLKDEIAIRDETIEQLQSNIKQMQVEHQRQIQEVKRSYEEENRKQSDYINKILYYFPYVEKLMPMIKYLSEKMGGMVPLMLLRWSIARVRWLLAYLQVTTPMIMAMIDGLNRLCRPLTWDSVLKR